MNNFKYECDQQINRQLIITKTPFEKDQIILLQRQRISELEREVEKLRREKDELNRKTTFLTFKLHAYQVSENNTDSDEKIKQIINNPQIPSHLSQQSLSASSLLAPKTLTRYWSYKVSTEDNKTEEQCGRAWAAAYELSQDLENARVDMLEKKYGGRITAGDAAKVIQHAFRSYQLAKNFRRLRSVSVNGERRLISDTFKECDNMTNGNNCDNDGESRSSLEEVNESSDEFDTVIKESKHIVNNVEHIFVQKTSEDIGEKSPICLGKKRDGQSPSPIWKRKSKTSPPNVTGEQQTCEITDSCELSNMTANSSLDKQFTSPNVMSYVAKTTVDDVNVQNHIHSKNYKRNPIERTDADKKRLYRIGLNLFNKKPEKGIKHLIDNNFLRANDDMNTAKFLLHRKGISKQQIGEYLGNTESVKVLRALLLNMSFSGIAIDIALRALHSYVSLPSEAHKIERLLEAFAKRYVECNEQSIKHIRSGADGVFVLSYAIIMLNTDLHKVSVQRKTHRKMKKEEFVANLKGCDAGVDFEPGMLKDIYDRISAQQLKPGIDHVTQVAKIEQALMAGKNNERPPNLSIPHRRLVCYCRLFQLQDPSAKKKEKLSQREVFLFNDLLLVAKLIGKNKKTTQYTYKFSQSLLGIQVECFNSPFYEHGLRIVENNSDRKILMAFIAKNAQDRERFFKDVAEAIAEVAEMEALRIDNNRKAHDNVNPESFSKVSTATTMNNNITLMRPISEPHKKGQHETVTCDPVMKSRGSFDSGALHSPNSNNIKTPSSSDSMYTAISTSTLTAVSTQRSASKISI